MEDAIVRLERKVDAVTEDIHAIRVILSSQHATLDLHIARTEALEAQVKPLRDAHLELQGAIKFVKMIGIVLAIAEAVRFLW